MFFLAPPPAARVWPGTGGAVLPEERPRMTPPSYSARNACPKKVLTPVSDFKALAHLLPLDEFLRLWEPQKWLLRTIWGL